MKHSIRSIYSSKRTTNDVAVEPAIAVPQLFADIPPQSKVTIIEGELRRIMNYGDSEERVLRMANYIINNIRFGFPKKSEENYEEKMMIVVISIVREYGASNGAELLKKIIDRSNNLSIRNTALRAFAEIAEISNRDYLFTNTNNQDIIDIFNLRFDND